MQVGLELLGAGLRGAKLNVEINLGSVKDADYAAKVRGEVDRVRARARARDRRAAVRALARCVGSPTDVV